MSAIETNRLATPSMSGRIMEFVMIKFVKSALDAYFNHCTPHPSMIIWL